LWEYHRNRLKTQLKSPSQPEGLFSCVFSYLTTKFLFIHGWHRYCSYLEFHHFVPGRRHDVPNRPPRRNDSIFDYILYAIAGGVLLAMSYSIRLWLQF